MITLEEYEKLNPRCELSTTVTLASFYATPNNHTKWRVDSLFTKEPCHDRLDRGVRGRRGAGGRRANVGHVFRVGGQDARRAGLCVRARSAELRLFNRNIVLNDLGALVDGLLSRAVGRGRPERAAPLASSRSAARVTRWASRSISGTSP